MSFPSGNCLLAAAALLSCDICPAGPQERVPESNDDVPIVANVFDEQPPQIADEVLAYSPLNSPANPRTIALVLNKRI